MKGGDPWREERGEEGAGVKIAKAREHLTKKNMMIALDDLSCRLDGFGNKKYNCTKECECERQN